MCFVFNVRKSTIVSKFCLPSTVVYTIKIIRLSEVIMQVININLGKVNFFAKIVLSHTVRKEYNKKIYVMFPYIQRNI